MHGRDGKDVVVALPLGTAVWIEEADAWKWGGELCTEGEEILAAVGGEGGRGNVGFASARNKVPLLAEEGGVGEEWDILLELRLPADVALVGAPNSGKSLIMRRITRAVPLVAAYPFTTREPVLGHVERDWDPFAIMELPGIVEGSYEGKGLGATFLRHLWRARVIVHIVDGSVEDPLGALRSVASEIYRHEPAFKEKVQTVVVSKCDLPDVRRRMPQLRQGMASAGLPVHFISALTGEGVEQFVADIHALLQRTPRASGGVHPAAKPLTSRLWTGRPVVTREGDVFVVSSPRAARLVRLPDLRQFQARLQLRAELAKQGVVRALEKAGVQPGDRVRIGSVELRWE